MHVDFNAILHGGKKRRFAAATVALILLVALLFIYPVSVGASWLSHCCDGGDCCIENDCCCPQCYGRGEPGGKCPDCEAELCPECGNCPECGTSPCPACRVCPECGSRNYCGTCYGCLDCGFAREVGCPECGDNEAVFPDANSDADTGIGIDDFGNPLFSIGGVDIFLFAPSGVSSWAILSLILTALGIGFTVFVICRAVGQKKDENDAIDEHSAILRNIDSFDNEKISRVVEDKERYNKRRRLGAFSLMYIFAATAVLLIILFQDFKGLIVLFDWWVIVHAALFAGVLVSGKFVFRKYEEFTGAGAMPLSAASPS